MCENSTLFSDEPLGELLELNYTLSNGNIHTFTNNQSVPLTPRKKLTGKCFPLNKLLHGSHGKPQMQQLQSYLCTFFFFFLPILKKL